MADYVTTGASGSKIAADEVVSGSDTLYFQRAKSCWGADGTVNDTSAAAPLPVAISTVLTPTVHAVASPMDTSQLMSGLTSLTPKFAVISTSAADTTIVAAVTSKMIRVLSLVITPSGGNGSIRFESTQGGTALTGVMDVLSDVPLVLPFNPLGWFQTASGQLLNLELTTITDADGCLTYVEV